MKTYGKATAAFDIKLDTFGAKRFDKEDPMDLLTDPGFALFFSTWMLGVGTA